MDSSAALDENDEEIIRLLKNKRVIVLMNKSDLKSVISEDELKLAIRNGLVEQRNFYSPKQREEW